MGSGDSSRCSGLDGNSWWGMVAVFKIGAQEGLNSSFLRLISEYFFLLWHKVVAEKQNDRS